jgi:hypothetical protein
MVTGYRAKNQMATRQSRAEHSKLSFSFHQGALDSYQSDQPSAGSLLDRAVEQEGYCQVPVCTLIPAVVLATAFALFGGGERFVELRDLVLDRDTREKRGLVGPQHSHGRGLVIVDRADGESEDIRGFFVGATKADQANDFSLTGGKRQGTSFHNCSFLVVAY